jgi:predicted small metal-binding protein
MKTMSCKQLGGACDQTFSANTFEEMASLSKEHGKEMFKKNDAAHLEAMRSM